MATSDSKHHPTEIWAQLILSEDSSFRIQRFLVNHFEIRPSAIVKKMHFTVYHSRRPMLGVVEVREKATVSISAKDFRFMVLSPGGENAREGLIPSKSRVGIRLHRQSPARGQIQAYRSRLIDFETKQVLGSRNRSNANTSAFGARSFQPHITLLHPKNRAPESLRPMGELFRERLGVLLFDEFCVDVIERNSKIIGVRAL